MKKGKKMSWKAKAMRDGIIPREHYTKKQKERDRIRFNSYGKK